MVLTQRFREELRNQGREEGLKEGREKGRAIGREEVQKAWVEWNERRVQAIETGREFNEPPPYQK